MIFFEKARADTKAVGRERRAEDVGRGHGQRTYAETRRGVPFF